ncbi:MAG: DUF2157 domain-containing protein [gamma proteobacterium symbiont of Lucinoma myriamae]|nr:DUF2157 domain-containing protein [gamma proteobacterium symbiont of Lucinoma myriamae]MCU7818593.1 DUF2157 domain-containing protein [gamma proteobacterium symbiont of Lucinoma myriamae]MCU7832375.1 DUF2157 domain-containing protein [gamma proteobacterium symbiont of Lucinoma myriamae]
MNNKQFYKKLQEKLPHWKVQSWLDEVSAQSILNDAYSDANNSNTKSHKISLILGIMGVMLLAVGVISFIAANWQGMSKIMKLSLLFSSMTAAYLASIWALSEQKYPALGEAFLLLGVLLFGNNIMLIAQIYHIDSHYPNAILLWAAGALVTAFIMKSEVVLITSVLLSLLWSGMEIFDFSQIHWHWLVFWSVCSVLTIRQGFHLAAHIMIVSFFVWLLFSFYSFSRYTSVGYLVQTYLLSGLLIFMLAETIRNRQYIRYFAELLSCYALIFSAAFLFTLSFPELDFDAYFDPGHIADELYTQVNFLIIQLVLMGLFLVASIKHFMANETNHPIKWLSVLWALVLVLCLLWNLFFYQEQQNIPVIIINVLLFSLVIGLIYSGLAEHKRFYVNLAFGLFTITLLSRYFDTFWGLMDRSLFFIVGGLLLIIGGYWLEKKRRQLNRQSASDMHQSILFTGDHDE